MGPDPGERLFSGVDLAHAFHSWSQLEVAARQLRFDAKYVLALVRLGERNVAHFKIQQLSRKSCQDQGSVTDVNI